MCMKERACRTRGQQTIMCSQLLLLLLLVCFSSFQGGAATEVHELQNSTRNVWTLANSPYYVRAPLYVDETGSLEVEAGVEAYFDANTGITVKGILLSKGTSDARVKFTKSDTSSAVDPSASRTIRLVDGETVARGRVELLYNGKWRPVCTRSHRWTLEDTKVACKQLGFADGQFYRWFPKRNSTRQLQYISPNCTGTEMTIEECTSAADITFGYEVCDLHDNIGIECWGFSEETKKAHWTGLDFQDALFVERNPYGDYIFTYNESLSVLEYTDISYAGVLTKDGHVNGTAAVQASGYPPILNDVKIEYSAFNALNYSLIIGRAVINNCHILNNRGDGIAANSTHGNFSVTGSTVEYNHGDGIRYTRADTSPVLISTFCTRNDLQENERYPLVMVGERTNSTGVQCARTFKTKRGILTLTILNMWANSTDNGQLVIRDGEYSDSPLLANLSIVNNTKPQAIQTTGPVVWLSFTNLNLNITRFTLEITIGRSYDLEVVNSNVRNNLQRGVSVYNLRSHVNIHGSELSENGYVAGLHVEDGAGDVTVNSSIIERNTGNGINITYSGGSRNITNSTFIANSENAISVWFNLTALHRPVFQRMEVLYSNFQYSEGIAILQGNFCLPHVFNVSFNTFSNNLDDVVYLESCTNYSEYSYGFIDKGYNLTFWMAWNEFRNNEGHGLRIVPAVNMHATIGNNTFEYQTRGSVLIRNTFENYWGDYPDYAHLPAFVDLSYNTFKNNRGRYVVSLGVSHGSNKQEAIFTKNWLSMNAVSEPFPFLNPRNRGAAVVAISSANTYPQRNYFDNGDSKFEMASHLDDHASEITASYNWWGTNDVPSIFEKIFDYRFRYNLAECIFRPYLPDSNLNGHGSNELPNYNKPFRNGNNIGGFLNGWERLYTGNTYTVIDDINIGLDGQLVIEHGVTVKFNHGLGAMVQGMLNSQGSSTSQNTFTLSPTVRSNSSVVRLSGSGGSEGRLEVYLEGRWGTVCREGWTVEDASIVCNQLGLALDDEQWNVLDVVPGVIPAIMSNVKCGDLDTDITKCRAEIGENQNSCKDTEVVGLRCKEAKWTGIRFSLEADTSKLSYTMIENAGLFDYATHKYIAAVQIDMNQHQLNNLKIKNNDENGLTVLFSNPFKDPRVENCEVSANYKNGIEVHSQYLRIHNTQMFNHANGAGFQYNPMLTAKADRDFISWLNLRQESVKYLPSDSLASQEQMLGAENEWYIVTEPYSSNCPVGNYQTIRIKTDYEYVIGVQLLHRGDNETDEKMMFYDDFIIADYTLEYDLHEDMAQFPLVTRRFELVIKYWCSANSPGNIIIKLTSVKHKDYYPRPRSYLNLTDVRISDNMYGMALIHYNMPYSEKGDVYIRYGNESLNLKRVTIENNKMDGIWSDTPHYRDSWAGVGEVTVRIDDTEIVNNGNGVRDTHRDMQSSNNIWHWELLFTRIAENMAGGFDIWLPSTQRGNRYWNIPHSVNFTNCTIEDNHNFKFRIAGHFSNVTMFGNVVRRNTCHKGLFLLDGTEKQLNITYNVFEENVGDYVFELQTSGQTELVGKVNATFSYNILRNNRFNTEVTRRMRGMYGIPRSYVIAIKGVQRVNVTENLFYDNQMDYTMVSGVQATSLNSYLNATFNWWDTTDQDQIRRQIFDFDDWNSYSIADFYPYLKEPDWNGIYAQDGLKPIPWNTDIPFGGRVDWHETFRPRGTPWVIGSDLTIMPNGSITIEAGTELQFYPSVGILVLGNLFINGKEGNPVRFNPVPLSNIAKREVAEEDADANVRLVEGTDRTNGFLEVWNATTNEWGPICDTHFTERNGQVVCRELGLDTVNVNIWNGWRADMTEFDILKISSKTEPVQCLGTEDNLFECDPRVNGNQRHWECDELSHFVYMSCGAINLEEGTHDYWGNIRFSVPHYEENPYVALEGRDTTFEDKSYIEYLEIFGAGMLHGEKAPAISTVYRSPKLNHTKINTIASHGFESMAPSTGIVLNDTSIVNGFGIGINVLVLNGEAADQVMLSYDPLVNITLSYHVFGILEACSVDKEVVVSRRMLVYYKYDNTPVDCVKIFRSEYKVNRLGFRLLYLNLLPGVNETSWPDSIELYDGFALNETTYMAEIVANDTQKGVFFTTTREFLSLHLHASAAEGSFGFIAEIVNYPGAITYDRNLQHFILTNYMENNDKGGLRYASVGETVPSLFVMDNCFVNNGVFLYNFTTSSAAALLDIQNTRLMKFQNNLVYNNTGGLHVTAGAFSGTNTLQGYIKNNVIAHNIRHEAMYLDGKRSKVEERIEISFNYFGWNNASDLYDVMLIAQIVSNFTRNTVFNNTGKYTLEVYGFDRIVPKNHQNCSANYIYNNTALGLKWKETRLESFRGTITVGNSPQMYQHNYLVNPLNDFEIVTINKSELDVWPNNVDGRWNWWGYSSETGVGGRIWDKEDNETNIGVTYKPFLETNETLTSGKCDPGWVAMGNSCHIYMGGAAPYDIAREICKREKGDFPYIRRTDVVNFLPFLFYNQENYTQYSMTWVASYDVPTGACAMIYRNSIQTAPCHYRFPFICEKNPVFYGESIWLAYWPLITAIVLAILLLILIILLAICWYCKSKQREKEHFERKESIRRSIREGSLRRKEEMKRAQMSDVTFVDMNTMDSTQKVNVSIPNGSSRNSLSSFEKPGAVGQSIDSFAKPPIEKSDSCASSDFTDEEDLEDTKQPNGSTERVFLDLEQQRAKMAALSAERRTPEKFDDGPIYANQAAINASLRSLDKKSDKEYDKVPPVDVKIPSPKSRSKSSPSSSPASSVRSKTPDRDVPRTRRSYQYIVDNDMMLDDDEMPLEPQKEPEPRVVPIYADTIDEEPGMQKTPRKPNGDNMAFKDIEKLPYEHGPPPPYPTGGRRSPTSISAVIEHLNKPRKPDPYFQDPNHRYPVGFKPHPVRSLEGLNSRPMPRAPRRKLPPPHIKTQRSYQDMLDQLEPGRDLVRDPRDTESTASVGGASEIPMKMKPYGFRKGGPYDGTSSIVDYIDKSEHGSLASHPYASMEQMDRFSMSTDASSLAPSETSRESSLAPSSTIPMSPGPSQAPSYGPSAVEVPPGYDTATVVNESAYNPRLSSSSYTNEAYDGSRDSSLDSRAPLVLQAPPTETSI